ncbi:MAG: cell envelope integrity EipB family protein [Roseibium sp.]
MEFVPTSVSRTAGTIMLIASAAVASGTQAHAANAGAAAGPVLVPHRAVYDMQLGDMEEQAGIAGLKGRMVYDFSGSACEGYSVNFRFVTEFQDKDGGSQITDLQTTSFEEPQAQGYQFLSKTFVDQELVESTRGTARADGEAKTVELKEPEEKSFAIGKEVLFPTEHLVSIIKAAEDEVHFVAADIYDGAETGEKVYATTTVIGAKAQHDPGTGAKGAEALLAGESYWPVTVAYFDPGADDASGELLPVYQLTFHLFGNGVSTDLKLDYGDFIIQGTMSSLELFEASPCPQN